MEYRLVVRTGDGLSERAATWTAIPGHTVTVPGSTALRPEDVVAIEMLLPDGTVVLRWEA